MLCTFKRCALIALPILALAACDSDPTPVTDGALPDVTDAALPDAPAPDAAPDLGAADAVWPDGPDAFALPAPPTTVQETVVGVLPASKQDSKQKILFGLTKSGPGEPHKERDDLLAKQNNSGTATGTPVSLFFGVQMTDVHIADEETPLRLVNYDNVVQAAYHMEEAYTTQVFDGMLRTINRLADYQRPFDAVVFTGDLIENNHLNELDWFIGVLDGKLIDPDSGTDEDPLPGPHNDAADAFQAAGLRSDVPWIAVVGNHDQLVAGSVSAIWPNGVPNNPLLKYFPGISALITKDDGCLIDCFDFGAAPSQQQLLIKSDPRYSIALGTSAAAAVYPTVAPVIASDIGPGTVAADPGRQLITLNQWVGAFLQSPSKPSGHGMSALNLTNDDGNYVYEPVKGLPLRIIALEMVSKSLPDGSALATLTRSTYDNFLVPQLDKAAKDNVLVLLISHHQSWSFPPKGLFTPSPLSASKRDLVGSELVAKINSYPNVVAHLVGHGHTNTIKAHAASDTDPLKGYWEIETCSTAHWPQQSRIVEIVDNRDGTGTLYATMLNADLPKVDVPDWKHKSVAAQGRHWALYDVQMGFGDDGAGTADDRNVKLHFAIPAAIRAKIDALQSAGSLTARTVQSTAF